MKRRLFAITTLSILVLTACSSYKVEVDLTDEERTELNAIVAQHKVEIAEYDYSTGRQPYVAILDLGNAYTDLGELGKAIKLYEDSIEDGATGRALFNNLGRIYEDVGEYDRAVEMYQRIIDEYFDEDYLYDITWAYINAKDRKNAEKYFNAWQLEFQKTDEQTQKAIKKLREEEKAAEAQ